ncbi:hypothetical protein C0V75_01980 [Tabrizicola sp. TH137]|uniref:hypothetical protein n=1 Tax=Tabrizicola sp. TH137 TaxID=2067452 RepID=UPI000C7AA2EE|nr:hypothetical protein [Tabrizicola sp. TH137]PLL14239.1 hypothetical protein C0V75_01980 [Tabrizicola sp. TH137]
MMDLAKPDQFDLDRLAEELGALPQAPLAMPVQQLESSARPGFLSALLRARLWRVGKAGH